MDDAVQGNRVPELNRYTPQRRVRNRLLAALPEEERQQVLRHAELLDLPQRKTLFSPAQPLKVGYFFESGMASELIRMQSGRAADVSPIGIEGFVGMPVLLNGGKTYHECVVQLPAKVWRIPGNELCQAYAELKTFRGYIHRYIHARFVQATQCSACNLLHSVTERLGRWLLLASHHADTSVFQVTQEFLSDMLGANRSTITIMLGQFQRSGLISYSRGVVHIENRESLNEVACECNQMITSAIDEVFE